MTCPSVTPVFTAAAILLLPLCQSCLAAEQFYGHGERWIASNMTARSPKLPVGSMLVAAQETPPPGDNNGPSSLEIYNGEIVEIKDDRLTLQFVGDEVTIVVPRDAVVLLNGLESSLEDLLPGMLAKVLCEAGDQQPTAKTVDASFQY